MHVQGVQEWTKYAALRGSGAQGQYRVRLPILTTWGLPIRNSRSELQREVFNPRLLGSRTSLTGIIVLIAEL